MKLKADPRRESVKFALEQLNEVCDKLETCGEKLRESFPHPDEYVGESECFQILLEHNDLWTGDQKNMRMMAGVLWLGIYCGRKQMKVFFEALRKEIKEIYDPELGTDHPGADKYAQERWLGAVNKFEIEAMDIYKEEKRMQDEEIEK